MTELEVTSLLIKLANLGVTGIKVEYEGSGDSGGIEKTVYTKDKLNEDDELALAVVHDLDAWDRQIELSSLDSESANELESYLYDKILDNVEDWWNNEGGYGSLAMLVPSGKYSVLNNIRYTQIETYAHEGSIIDKSAE